jgi:predicted transcriptional regulator
MKPLPLETKFNPLGNNFEKGVCKSKLEQYLDILRLLSSQGSVNLRFIMQQTGLNSDLALEYLKSLVELNLVEKETGKFGFLYSILNRGEKAVRFFG